MTDLIAELAKVVRLREAWAGSNDEASWNELALHAVNFVANDATLTRTLTDDAVIRAAHHDLVIRLGEVTTELEAARKDAARYRFVRSADADADQPYIARHGLTDWGKSYDQWLMEDDADAAIDAAMKESGKMIDLTERLRALSRHEHDGLSIGDESADEIERLREKWADAETRCALLNRRTRELDELQARIEGSSKHVAEWTASHGLTFFDAPTDLDGKRVALVVLEDGE